MTNYNLERSEFFKAQLILSALTIGTLIISMILTYNEKLIIENKEPILTDDENSGLLVINRIIAVFIAISFLGLNIYDRKTKEHDGILNLKYADLQIDASALTLIASIIVLYVVMNDKSQPITNLENPQL